VVGETCQFFFPSFSGNCLVSSSCSEVVLFLRFWRSALWPTSYLALELGFHFVGLLGACFFASCPFSGSWSENHQPALCCQHVILVCWLFFNFATLFDFECCSLAQEMSLVYCSSWSPAHCWPFCLSSLCLLKVHVEISSLFLHPSMVHSEHPAPSTACSFSVSCLLFSFFFFFAGWGQSLQGVCWFIPGVAVWIPHSAYLLYCWSVSPKQVWSQHLVAWEPSCFLSLMWHGLALYQLEVQSVRVLMLLGGFVLPNVATASQQNFWFMELTLLLSSTRHLRSLMFHSFIKFSSKVY
jgi:hypothetical protein